MKTPGRGCSCLYQDCAACIVGWVLLISNGTLAEVVFEDGWYLRVGSD